MIICGLKLTHDGAISLIDNGRLVFCYELEKLDNNERYASLKDHYTNALVTGILKEHGYTLADVDRFVIDGWGDHDSDNTSDHDYPAYKTAIKDKAGQAFEVELNGYGLLIKENEDLLKEAAFSYPEHDFSYSSYLHISGHLMSGYCTSPFAKNNEDAFMLIWDGGMMPQLFYMHADTKKAEPLGAIFHLLGISYSSFASNYKPFNHLSFFDLSIAGKLMAYIALGKCRPEVLSEFKRLFAEQENEIAALPGLKPKALIAYTSKLLSSFVIYGELNDVEPVDMLTTFHYFLQDILLEQLAKAVARYPDYVKNLCFVGGCALNIKWNSNIRNSGLFKSMWVPPFPNDAGSAVGAACCEMISKTGSLVLDWNVYKGPAIKQGQVSSDAWDEFDFTVAELAQLLHLHDEPVVFLNGRAELGPRALGNRSILGAPVNLSMKRTLNRIKKREDYRPVAPICMEEDARHIFLPGTPDPLMLYDHLVKEEWKDKIPAVCHLDGTARLQTISRQDNPVIYELLGEYKKLSGIPLLCNTSANLSGKGFFPDAESAMAWNEVDMVWYEGRMFVKRESAIYNNYWTLKRAPLAN